MFHIILLNSAANEYSNVKMNNNCWDFVRIRCACDGWGKLKLVKIQIVSIATGSVVCFNNNKKSVSHPFKRFALKFFIQCGAHAIVLIPNIFFSFFFSYRISIVSVSITFRCICELRAPWNDTLNVNIIIVWWISAYCAEEKSERKSAIDKQEKQQRRNDSTNNNCINVSQCVPEQHPT